MTGIQSGARASVQYIGTATMVLRFGPLTLLTDPNFLHRGQFAYLGYGLATRRRTEPALQIDELPPLDAILLSHMHGDHWDRVAKHGLPRRLPIFTTHKAAKALHRQHFTEAQGLDTWQDTLLERDGHSLSITATPGRHATGATARLLPPVMGSVLRYVAPDGRGLLVYITGDTLFVDELRQIPQRFPDIDVTVLHLGGTTLPGGLVVTMGARDGADLAEFLQSPQIVPVHHSDYGVFKSPLSMFLTEMKARSLDDRVRVARPGQTLDLLA